MKACLAPRELSNTSKVFAPLAMLVEHKLSSSLCLSHNKKVWKL